MSAPSFKIEHRQQQTLTPRLQHAVRLLQLSSLDFAQEVQQAMGKNPFLEFDDAAAENPAGEGAPDESGAADQNDNERALPAAPDAASDSDAELAWERTNWQLSPGGGRAGGSDSDSGAMELVAAAPGLRQHLLTQINVLPLSPRDHALACTIVESLDDDGYLRLPLDELAAFIEIEPEVTECEMNAALRNVQSLDPCGVGARSVVECLLLQLPSIEDVDERELARRILSEQLDRLAQREVGPLSRALGVGPAQTEAVCERIRQLDPRPGLRFAPPDVQFVTPDVIVKRHRDTWVAALNPAVIPRVRLNQVYAELFERHREAEHAELAAHLQEARWTVRNVEQRFSTILTVAEAILRRQQHFLCYGPLAMKPLGLREIAEEVGLHESTVCRVTNNKYMATPAGVFELKYFFSRAMPTASGGSCSATAIRGLIKDMIEGEDPSAPLSDVEIARQLARQGLTVARRTITKYRQMLKLPAVERRRRHSPVAAASPVFRPLGSAGRGASIRVRTN